MMQGFEWYAPADQKHWRRLQAQIPQLKAWGIDNIWIPPAYVTSLPFQFKLINYIVAKLQQKAAMDMMSTICLSILRTPMEGLVTYIE